MKRITIICIIIILIATRAYSDATINISNYGSLNPIYLFKDVLFPVEGAHVSLGVNLEYGFVPVENPTDFSFIWQFPLKKPGFFDAGVGLVPGTQDFTYASFTLRAWRGADEFELAPVQGSVTWTQRTGGWDRKSTPTGPDLQNPVLILIPEPSIIVLGLLGALGLIIYNETKEPKARSTPGIDSPKG